MTSEGAPEDNSDSIQAQLADIADNDPSVRLRLMALVDDNLRARLFVMGIIDADEAGPGFSYSPDGTMTADQTGIDRLAGLMIRPIDEAPPS